jgi:hypothetical protein
LSSFAAITFPHPISAEICCLSRHSEAAAD